MGCRAASLLITLVAVLGGREALAQVPRHESPTVSPMKRGGKVVGFRLKTILRTTMNYYPDALVGLVDPAKIGAVTRQGAADSKLGQLRLQFPREQGVTVAAPREVQFEVKYGDGNDLKPGDKVRILSAWPMEGNPTSIHVFGAVMGASEQGHELTLPAD